jgi:ABC-type transport system involved in multi-copper enzyme maturation permease subunit
MNVQTIKEIRSLGPFWIAAFLLPVVPLFWLEASPQAAAVWSITGYVFGCALLACASFSTEWNHQTMDLLLAQPVSRRQIWRNKMSMLRLALLTLLPASAFALVNSGGELGALGEGIFAFFWLIFPIVWALSAGPFMSLIMGNGIAAVVSTLGAPLMWVVTVLLLMPKDMGPGASEANAVFCVFGLPLLLMAIAIHRMGKNQFLNLQTSGFPSAAIRMPAWIPWIGRSGAAATAQPHIQGNAWGRILAKEFRLHDVSYIIAGFMILAAGLLVAYQPIYVRTVPEPRDDQIIMQLVIVVVFICGLIIPFTVGAGIVAEERQMGVLDWHLTLPPSHRKQWLIKIAVAYFHCIVLGIVLPFVVGLVALALLAHPGPFQPGAESMFSFRFLMIAFSLGGSSLLLCTLAMFASSLARTSMRALVLTMETLILTGVLCGMSNLNNYGNELFDNMYSLSATLGLGCTWFGVICGAFMLAIIHWLNYLNYRRLEAPLRAGLQLVIVSAAATILIGVPFFVVKAWDLEAQRLETGLSPRAFLAYRNNDHPELVLKEISAALDRPAVNGKNSVQGTVYTLFSNGYRELPEAQSIIYRALTNADFGVRYAGINLLTDRLNNAETNSAEYRRIVTEFEKALKDPHSNVRFLAARALAIKGLDLEQVIALLIENVSDVKAASHHRQWVTQTLGELGPKAKSAVPALIQAVETTTNVTDKLMIYRTVTNALAKIDPSALSQLKPVPAPQTKATGSPGLGVKP